MMPDQVLNLGPLALQSEVPGLILGPTTYFKVYICSLSRVTEININSNTLSV